MSDSHHINPTITRQFSGTSYSYESEVPHCPPIWFKAKYIPVKYCTPEECSRKLGYTVGLSGNIPALYFPSASPPAWKKHFQLKLQIHFLYRLSGKEWRPKVLANQATTSCYDLDLKFLGNPSRFS